MKSIAIITGASSGIGREFAMQLEKSGYDEIWLVARRLPKLKQTASALTHTKGVTIKADLGKQEDIARLISRVRNSKANVALLINNAGYGKFGSFQKMDKNLQTGMVDLNTRSLTELSYEILPFMSRGSAIIQVASLLAYIPFPYFSVYAATKAFVLHFSLSLAAEVEHLGIQVMALCPGPVATEFALVASGKDTKIPGEWPVDKTVSKAIKHLRKGRWISIPRFLWRIMAFSRHFMSKKRTSKMLGKRVPKMYNSPDL